MILFVELDVSVYIVKLLSSSYFEQITRDKNIKLVTRMAQIGKIEHFQIGEDWESYEERLQQYMASPMR